jgi:hypothetical protein
MANGNGTDRLDRIEAAVEALTGIMGQMVQQQVKVVEGQQRFQLDLIKLEEKLGEFAGKMGELAVKMGELQEKLDGLVVVVESEHRNFNERLKRIES